MGEFLQDQGSLVIVELGMHHQIAWYSVKMGERRLNPEHAFVQMVILTRNAILSYARMMEFPMGLGSLAHAYLDTPRKTVGKESAWTMEHQIQMDIVIVPKSSTKN